MNIKNEILGIPALSTTKIGQLAGFYMPKKFIVDVLGVAPDEENPHSNMWRTDKVKLIYSRLSQHAKDIAEQVSLLEIKQNQQLAKVFKMKNKSQSIELIVLEKLLEKGEEGVTILDFPEHLLISEDVLESVMKKL